MLGVQRTKKLKKNVSFYRNSFGMHPPYLIICDGNFIFAALDSKVDLKKELSTAFRGQIYLKTSKCIRAEIDSRASKETEQIYFDACQYAKDQCQLLHCDHKIKNPYQCILKALKHNFKGAVGTQNKNLQDTIINKFPSIPVFYISHERSLQIIEPSKKLRSQIHQKLESKYGNSKPEPETLDISSNENLDINPNLPFPTATVTEFNLSSDDPNKEEQPKGEISPLDQKQNVNINISNTKE